MSLGVARSLRTELLAWLMGFSLVLLGIAHQTDWGQRLAWPIDLPEMPPAAFVSPALSPPYMLPPPDAFLETSLRPVFVSTRRPAPIRPPEPPPKPTMKRGQFVLTGTTIAEGKKYAHLIEVAGGKPRTVTEGAELNGIVVKEITPAGVLLTQGDESESLALRKPQR